MKAAKHFAPPPPDAAMPGGLAGAARGAKRILVMAGGAALVLLALYVMWPRVRGFGYGYDGVEETEHFVTVSGTQVRGAGAEKGQREAPAALLQKGMLQRGIAV